MSKNDNTRESHRPLTLPLSFSNNNSLKFQRFRRLLHAECLLGVYKRQSRLFQQRREKLNADLPRGIQAFFAKQALEFQQTGSKYLNAYTKDTEYKQVNAALRTDSVSCAPKDIRDIIEGATKALKTGLCTGMLKGCYGNELYRASSTVPASAVPVAGGTWSDKAFLSTSFKLKAAVRFLPNRVVDEEPYLFVIKGVTACYIQSYSEYKHEGEFLFRPSTLFRVHAVKRGQTVKGARTLVTIVEMSEIY